MEETAMIRRDDWLLLALDGAKGLGLTPVQLQKVLFVFGREMPAESGQEFYQFTPYHYGPFTPAIYSDVESLAARGLAAILGGGNSRTYAVTPDGAVQAGRIAQQAPMSAVQYLRSLVEWAQSLSFAELVRAVYAKYPGTDANSIFRR